MASSNSSFKRTRRPKRKADRLETSANPDDVRSSSGMASPKRSRRYRLRRREYTCDFPYVNWMDDEFVQSATGKARNWLEFVSNIGGQKNLRIEYYFFGFSLHIFKSRLEMVGYLIKQ